MTAGSTAPAALSITARRKVPLREATAAATATPQRSARVAVAQGQVDELGVDADAQRLAVPVVEIAIALAERGDLRGAYEGEVLGPEEHRLPAPGKVVAGQAPDLAVLVQAHRRLEVER